MVIVMIGYLHLVNKSVSKNCIAHHKMPGAYKSLEQWADARSYPNNTFEPKSFSNAFALKSQMEANQKKRNRLRSISQTAPWESLAPKNFAGRVLTIGFQANNPNIMWVGTASGGLWKTTNGGHGASNGINWSYIPTGFPTFAISSVVVHPTNPNIILIGTGEVYNDNTLESGNKGGGHVRVYRGTYGIGILKSIDGGQTWTKSLDFSYSNKIGITDMVFDPNNPSFIYASSSDGLYRSTDIGSTWTKVSLPGNPLMGRSIKYKPGNSSVMYVSFGNFGSTNAGIYKTVNASSAFPTFVKLAHTNLPTNITGYVKLSVSAANSNYLFASIGNNPASTTDPEGLYRSTDEGLTWTALRIGSNSIIGQQGWYAHDLVVSNSNINNILWGEIDMYKSTNGGSSFTKKSSWDLWNVNNTTIGTLMEGTSNTYVHADTHSIQMSPHDGNTVFICTDGGIFRSTDFGETYQTLNGGLQTSQIYSNAAISMQDPNFMLLGLQDNEGMIYRGQPGCSRVPNLGDGFHAAIHPSNHNTCYIASYNLNVKKSTNNAISFSNTSFNGFGDINGPYTTCFNAPFVTAPSNPNTIYGGTALFKKSTDGLATFTNMGGNTNYPSGLYSPIFYMAVAPTDANIVYFSTTPSTQGTSVRSKLFKTTNGGSSFVEITGNLPDRYYSDIAIHPTDPNIIVVSLSGFGSSHLYISKNGGNNWTNIGTGLPDIPHNTVVFDPTDLSTLYVGNDLGVFYAQNLPGGTLPDSVNLTWISYNDGLGDGAMISDIIVTPDNKLRIATWGKGLWERDLAPPYDCKVITNTWDSGQGSLRNAIDCAANGDTIWFSQNVMNKSILLTSANLNIGKNLTFMNINLQMVTINASLLSDLFEIPNNITVKLVNLNLVCGNGNLTNGRCVNNLGTLELDNVHLYDHQLLTSGSSIYNHGAGNVIIKNNVSIKKQ